MAVIDRATHTDIESLIALESGLFREDSARFERFGDPTWPEREGRKDFEDLLADDEAVVFVAREDSRPVGFLAGYSTTSSPTRLPTIFGVLRSLYVDPASRRGGVAAALVTAFVDWSKDCGCSQVHVDSYASNEGAAALYEAHGFAPLSVTRVLDL